jgi:hypothetical protein
MGFTGEQRQALTAKLDGRVIRQCVQAGQTLSYIEGWHAIAEANRVFGFEGWDRETVALRCVWEGARQGKSACAHIAQVRIRVRAGDTLVCRDGHGSGMGSGPSPGEAHETAARRRRQMPPSGRWRPSAMSLGFVFTIGRRNRFAGRGTSRAGARGCCGRPVASFSSAFPIPPASARRCVALSTGSVRPRSSSNSGPSTAPRWRP